VCDGPQRSTKMMDWTVKHHTRKHGTRYEVQPHEAKLLKGELEKGAAKIQSWLEKAKTSLKKVKDIISYSLFGSNPRYTDGAIANAKLMKEIYPGWDMRVYYDNSVPMEIIEQLKELQVQLVDMTNSKMNKMSWRFQAASDAKRFCARDIDSRLSKREAAAVEEWVQSGKQFHVMRDHPSHSNYPMSGGMWCSATIPNMEEMLTDVKNQAYLQDMNFLNKVIWPMAQKSLLQHDSFSCDKFGGGKPFPTPRVGWEHVGSVYINGKMRQGDVDILKKTGVVERCAKPPAVPATRAQPKPSPGARILYVVLTSLNSYADRVPYIWDTWGTTVVAPDRIVFASDQNITAIAGLPQWVQGGDSGWGGAQQRFLDAIGMFPLRHNEWLMLVDDDAFVQTSFLRALVTSLRDDVSGLYGQLQCGGNLCGGGGALLSPALLGQIRATGLPPAMERPYDQVLTPRRVPIAATRPLLGRSRRLASRQPNHVSQR
jgi:hypothetical protein